MDLLKSENTIQFVRSLKIIALELRVFTQFQGDVIVNNKDKFNTSDVHSCTNVLFNRFLLFSL
ncbi:hypothetical protein, partial [Aliivibrio fischeri]